MVNEIIFEIISFTKTYMQPIFQDQNGLAVKFFIQKDLPQEIQAELCEMITVRSQSPAVYYRGRTDNDRVDSRWSCWI